MRKIKLIVFSMILAGCAGLSPSASRPVSKSEAVSNLTHEQIATADYGSYPTDYENIIKQYFETHLENPTEIIYRNITSPKKWHAFVPTKGVRFGYVICVSINAKSSYGKYVGFSHRALLIRNDKVIESDVSEDGCTN